MHKDTTIFSELQEFFLQNDSHRAIYSIYRTMSSIRINSKAIGISKADNCQYTPLQVLHLLILFPFFVVKDASVYGRSALSRLFHCQKDVFYRFLRDDNIDWRNILYQFNLQVIRKIAIRSGNQKSGTPVCLIVDDTDMPKTGKQIENIGRIYSHVDHRSLLGFKGLFLARTDGKTQTVLDFSLHGEAGKNPEKPQGMSKKQLSKRFCKVRDDESKAQRRIEEYKKDKQTCLKEMVSNAIRKGIRFDYLLVDSWFTCKELVHYIMRRHIKCHFLGMVKMGNTKYATKEYGDLTAKGCIDKLSRVKHGIRYSKRLHCYYGEMSVSFDGIPVRLFFCRRGRHGSWNGLLSTNTDLGFFEAYKIYSMRWSIEVCFSEMKGVLRLGKCQARDFSEQIASISITIIQYNLLGLVKRFESYETIGSLFAEVTCQTVEMSIVDKIWLLIVEVVTSIAEQISADYDELMESAIHGNKHLAVMFAPFLSLPSAA